MNASLRTFIGFILAGGTATVVNYALFLTLYWLGLNYLIASALGYASGIVVSFTINRLFVFTESESRKGQLLRYTLVYLGALGAQLLLLELGVRLGLDPAISNGIALIIVVVGNYFVIRRLVFRVR